MKVTSKISGYDLAKSIFDECGGRNIDALVDFAGGETDWLEFKAGLFARDEDLTGGENQDDMLWHVARAVFGFLNSSGGLLVLGITDGIRQNTADLRKSKNGDVLAKEGMEAFLRKVVEPNLPPRKKSWATGKSGQWNWLAEDLDSVKDALEIHHARYRNLEVVLVFVKPLPSGSMELVNKQGDRQILLYRRRGSVASVDSMSDFHEIDKWVHHRRHRETKDFASILKRFLDERKKAIRPKKSAVPSTRSVRPSRSVPNLATTADRLLCPNCNHYIAIPPKDGLAKCLDCGNTYYCGVHQPNFVPQTDSDSDGLAVAKWLLLSFNRWSARRDSNSKLRDALHIDKKWKISTPGVTPDDFKSVLEEHGLYVEQNDETTDPLDGRDSWMRRVLGEGARIAIRYSMSHFRREYNWIGIERYSGHLRVMDPIYACGYLSHAQWRDNHASDISAWNTVFAIYGPD